MKERFLGAEQRADHSTNTYLPKSKWAHMRAPAACLKTIPWKHQIIKCLCGRCLLFSQDVLCRCGTPFAKESKWLSNWTCLAGRLFPTEQCGREQMRCRRSWWGAGNVQLEKGRACWEVYGAQTLPGSTWKCHVSEGIPGRHWDGRHRSSRQGLHCKDAVGSRRAVS